MKISFTTKEESNASRREEFLKLSPPERVWSFFRMIYEMRDFPTNAPQKKDNFIIIIDSENKND